MRNLGWLLSCGRSMRFLSHASLPVPFSTLLAGGSEWSLAFFFFSVLFCHWLFFGYAFLVTLGERLVLASAFCTLVRCLALALQSNLFVSGWFYGADTLSFHFRVLPWFFLSI